MTKSHDWAKRNPMEIKNVQKFPLLSEIKKKGFLQMKLAFPKELADALKLCNWQRVDQLLFEYLEVGAFLRTVLDQFHPYNTTEHMIAIRDARTDEDGIWHDDGSRHFAFTWSFNDDPELEGGELLFKVKNSTECTTITPPAYETLTVFLTGEYNYEHKVNKVSRGVRKNLVGWCSTEA
ncbi:hypothetical protein A9Q84_10585 [Halobacteriovorax marinus]|uniref:Prolyl 4-hydroxylase alpha subunit Fe(2+) 2OG dioxygenase domain-containing protein n=1 Tax=Halobacteriovorax marinus TaxID=97084 RepID=A0A1Y5FCV2_9BACT|nr:hypothetical protein A9Q84_10585 [Halobacteriovorax marinus]